MWDALIGEIREAGDEISPEEKRFTSTNIVLHNDFRGRPREVIPLEPSGLLETVTSKMAVIKQIYTVNY